MSDLDYVRHEFLSKKLDTIASILNSLLKIVKASSETAKAEHGITHKQLEALLELSSTLLDDAKDSKRLEVLQAEKRLLESKSEVMHLTLQRIALKGCNAESACGECDACIAEKCLQVIEDKTPEKG